eukprot:COSAG02_NODE_2785_length_8032_cov_173.978066_3_plen_72_part_00
MHARAERNDKERQASTTTRLNIHVTHSQATLTSWLCFVYFACGSQLTVARMSSRAAPIEAGLIRSSVDCTA